MTDTGSLNIEPGAVTAMLEGFPIAGSLRWQRKSADSINWTVDGQLKSRYLPLNCIFQDCWIGTWQSSSNYRSTSLALRAFALNTRVPKLQRCRAQDLHPSLFLHSIPYSMTSTVVLMSMTGKISTICRPQEYAIIDPDNGSSSVYVYADDFGQNWKDITPGTPVRFSSLQGIRGLKAYNVIVSAREPSRSLTTSFVQTENAPAVSSHNDSYRRELNVARWRSYEDLITAVLKSAVPFITPEQVSQVCKELTECAIRRGWLDLSLGLPAAM